MTHVTRRKSLARRWLIADVDQLERRALMTASATKHVALTPTHVEVGSKTVHAEVIKPTVHAEAKKSAVHTEAKKPAHPSTVKTESKKATPKTESAKPVAKKTTAKPKVTTSKSNLSLTDSTIVVYKKSQAGSGPVPGALGPIQLETAYTTSALGAANEGQGETIGIVDEYNDPNIVTDANTFSTKYGLPDFNIAGGPTLTVYKDTALGAVPNSPSGNGDTSVETSLDVEYAHAMAPKADIILVEVPASGTLDQSFAELLHGVQYAASHPIGTDHMAAVSLSYGYVETNVYQQTGSFIDLPALYSQNQTYLATGAATNVAITVSSGDYALPLFPSTSPNVIAVGGTALHLTASGQYSYETAWGGSQTSGAGGGGTSAFFSAPTDQTSNGVNINGFRATPDVALVADPATGVSVYDTYGLNSSAPWQEVGGTSLASPLFAGILTLAQQQRTAASKAALTTAQILNAIYSLYDSPSYSTYFHDVTLGTNNDYGSGYPYYSATTGYDRATGIGSPIAKTLVPYLASL
jgi:subtilase family serine protease